MSVCDAFRLDGQVAFVNGAGRGIGAACALALAEAGADVALTALEREEAVATARAVRDATGRRTVAFTIAATGDELGALEAAAAELGHPTILVNVAGGAPAGHVSTLTDDQLSMALELNLALPLRLVRAALAHFAAAGGGSVVNISSAMAALVAPGFVAYGAAKAALEHATRLLAADVAPSVRVNAVAPGAVLTRALERFVAGRPDASAAVAEVPLGRLASPEDVAAAVVYLSSPAASYVTGQVLRVDGGIRAPVFPAG